MSSPASSLSQDEIAVVVGSTGAIGGAIARRLIGKGLGVVALGRDRAKLDELEAESPGFRGLQADLSEDGAIDALKAGVDRPVRMAVMCAGLPVRGNALTIEPGGLAKAANLKVDGLVRLLRGLDDNLVAGSRVVVITGFLGLEPTAHEAAPGAINAAVHNLVRQTAELYGPRGVTVHAVCPGPVDTQRLRNIAKRVADERNLPVDDVMDEYKSTSSLNALITTDQVAWAASILLDDEASALHGATLSVTGGRLRGIW